MGVIAQASPDTKLKPRSFIAGPFPTGSIRTNSMSNNV